MTTIVDQIEQHGIRWGLAAADWRALTRQVGQMLVEEHLAEAAYTEAMVANVERNGPYLVIAPGVVLLHARPDEGALANAVVVGTATPPVKFGHSSNDPVWLVLALTATGDLEHTTLLQGVALMLAQDGALDRLRAAPDAAAFTAELRALESSLGQPGSAPRPPDHA